MGPKEKAPEDPRTAARTATTDTRTAVQGRGSILSGTLGKESYRGTTAGMERTSGAAARGSIVRHLERREGFLHQTGMLERIESSAMNGWDIVDGSEDVDARHADDENCDVGDRNSIGCCHGHSHHGHSHGGIGTLAIEDGNRVKNTLEVLLDIAAHKVKVERRGRIFERTGSVTVLSWCLLAMAGFCHVSTSICAMINVASIVPSATASWLSTSATSACVSVCWDARVCGRLVRSRERQH